LLWKDGEPAGALVNATIYLEAAGVAWIWLHQVLAAHGKTGDFYEGKRLATRYFFHHDLPKTTAQFDLSTAATEPRPIWTKTGSSVADARARRCIPAAVSPRLHHRSDAASASRLVALANSPE